MKIKLDYTILDISERRQIVQDICDNHADELTVYNLETLSEYLIHQIEKEERKQRKILTQNRLATVNKRETSLEGLTSKFENGEDGVYQLMHEDKNVILSPAISITKQDLIEIPYLVQIKEAINLLKTVEVKNYIVHQAIIDLSKTQYIVKDAFRKPVMFTSFPMSSRTYIDLDKNIDYTNPAHIVAILHNYSTLKTNLCDDIINDLHWILIDVEDIIERGIKHSDPMLYDVLVMRLENHQNQEIRDFLQEKYGTTYSIEYLSSLFNNKIPKLIAKTAEDMQLDWYYTYVEKGKWKKCSRCGQVKLLHNKYFSKNSSNKDGFYSICKCCRNKKK